MVSFDMWGETSARPSSWGGMSVELGNVGQL